MQLTNGILCPCSSEVSGMIQTGGKRAELQLQQTDQWPVHSFPCRVTSLPQQCFNASAHEKVSQAWAAAATEPIRVEQVVGAVESRGWATSAPTLCSNERAASRPCCSNNHDTGVRRAVGLESRERSSGELCQLVHESDHLENFANLCTPQPTFGWNSE